MTTIEVKVEDVVLTPEQEEEFSNGSGIIPTQLPKQEGDE